jgi:aspartyl-tRNA(Asn)/glutamyl-tRNA(Gln) amidotransferase subunit A
MLKSFSSPYDATVVKLLEDAGAVMTGKTNMDEFGMGTHSINTAFGPVENMLRSPKDGPVSAGGSSGGSAVAAASGQCYAAIGTDTGGSIRLPAAYCGIVGFKPSYGLISRYGVVAYANSLDTVGMLSSDVSRVKEVFQVLNQHDPKDPTSLTTATRSRFSKPTTEPLRFGVPLDLNTAELSPAVRTAWLKLLSQLSSIGTIHPVSIPMTKHALSIYYILASAEASSNLAKYDGVRFGSRSEGLDDAAGGVLFAKTRGEHFGEEVKRRIMLGAYSLSSEAKENYFLQAQRLRRKLVWDFDAAFRVPNPLAKKPQERNEDGVDILVFPTAQGLPPTLKNVKEQSVLETYCTDVLTVPASLAGLPALNIPTSIDTEGDIKTTGIQLVGQFGQDEAILEAGLAIEQLQS